MGFFNKILKGLGFEDEEVNNKKPVKEKVKKEKVKSNNVYASFDLNQNEEDEQKNLEIKEQVEEIQPPNETVTTDNNFSIFRAKSQVEVQMVVDKIKNGERVLLNLTEMSSSDITRSLDFLTGAVYALNRTMQKVDGNVYLIQ